MNTQTQIDALVDNSSASVGPRANTSPDMRFDGETGQVTVLSATPTTGRIPDQSEHDPMAEIAQVEAGINTLQAQLSEQVYDPATGTPSPKLTGRARELVEIQLASANNARHYAAVRAAMLFGQRETDAAAE